jgi:hypothetical protein
MSGGAGNLGAGLELTRDGCWKPVDHEPLFSRDFQSLAD